jgi:hypothetical protein
VCTNRKGTEPDKKRRHPLTERKEMESGDVLLSHKASLAVPLALEGLTAVFGMGTGVAPPPWSPESGESRGRNINARDSSFKRECGANIATPVAEQLDQRARPASVP